ncbi:MAG: DUF4097 family beta strand repeat-containing protein [Thermotogota bacterium]
MRKGVLVPALVILVALGVSLGSLGGGAGFGFGGGGAMVFFPDLSGVNAFLSENGLGPLSNEFLVGGGGGGRGGLIGGMAFGGMGFGVVAESEGADRSAELVVGAGGFDVGLAVGGNETSVLAVGVVLGGGAAVLDLSFWDVVPLQGGRGIVPVPVETREIGRAFGFVLPYVSLEAQVLAFVGLEVRIGYLVPVVGVDFGELVSVPAPSLDFSGPFLGFSLAFGGIDGGGEKRDANRAETSRGSIDLGNGRSFSLESGAGTIQITSYAVEGSQTSSAQVIEWEAVRHAARARDLDGLQVDVVQAATGIEMRSVGKGQIDYTIRIPAGTNLDVVDGSGRIEISSYAGTEVSISLGAGEIVLDDVQAATLSVTAGVGSLSLSRTQVSELTARIGMGEINLVVLPDVSATIVASVGMGELTIAGFPDVVAAPQGVVRRTLRTVLGSGAAQITLSAGIGQIGIVSTAP